MPVLQPLLATGPLGGRLIGGRLIGGRVLDVGIPDGNREAQAVLAALGRSAVLRGERASRPAAKGPRRPSPRGVADDSGEAQWRRRHATTNAMRRSTIHVARRPVSRAVRWSDRGLVTRPAT